MRTVNRVQVPSLTKLREAEAATYSRWINAVNRNSNCQSPTHTQGECLCTCSVEMERAHAAWVKACQDLDEVELAQQEGQ